MKIIFVYPSMGEKEIYSIKRSGKKIKARCLEPLGIATLNGLTPKSWQRAFFDDRVQDIDYDKPADLIAISVETYTAKRAYEISEEFKKRGKKIILGGFHPSACPDECLQHADSVLIGEAENIWEEILNDAEKNRLKKKYKATVTKEFTTTVDKSIFRNIKYLPFNLVESGRGCVFNCDFCSVTEHFGNKYRRRNIKEVINEIKKSKLKDILFVDDNIVSDHKSAKELFKALIPLKIRWYSQASMNLVMDDELLNLMNKSGCGGLLLGIESLNKNNLKQMGKHQNLVSLTNKNLDKVRRAGIKIYGSFVIGYDEDTENTALNYADYAIKQKFAISNFYQLTPMPGTRLYERLKEKNELLMPEWWLNPNYSYGICVYKHPNTDEKALSNSCFNARKKFFSKRAIIWRALDFKANSKDLYSFGVYLIANIVSRKEVNMRNGRLLGRKRLLKDTEIERL